MRNFVLIASILGILTGCDNKEEYSKVSIQLTDAPAVYQQVNVEILKVRAMVVDNNGDGTWNDLNTNSGIYDLLTLQNGIDTTLADFTQVPAGEITQLRMVLGDNNTIMADSVVHPLTVPSGQESGVKINGKINLVPNQPVSILLDFDAAESVIETGNGNFQLKPVIKTIP